jgi:large subunit ribosomal protein L18
LKNTIAQIIVAKVHGDEVLASAHSRELIRKYGWKGATGNVPAAYLTGLLCGLKAKKNGVEGAILDLGLVSPVKGSRVFSTMAGVLDAGVEVPHGEGKILKERTDGDHIAEYAAELGAPEEYAPKFSQYIANKLSPTDLGEHFEKVKAAIFAEYGVTYTPKPKAEKKPKPKPKAEVKAPQKAAAPVKAPAPAAPAAKVAAPAAETKAEAKPKAHAKAEAEAHEKKAEKPAKAEKSEKAEKAEQVEAKPAKAKAAKSEAKDEEEPKAKGKAKKAEAEPAKAKAKSAKGKSEAKSGGKKE